MFALVQFEVHLCVLTKQSKDQLDHYYSGSSSKRSGQNMFLSLQYSSRHVIVWQMVAGENAWNDKNAWVLYHMKRKKNIVRKHAKLFWLYFQKVLHPNPLTCPNTKWAAKVTICKRITTMTRVMSGIWTLTANTASTWPAARKVGKNVNGV